jgi:hypothetical protein
MQHLRHSLWMVALVASTLIAASAGTAALRPAAWYSVTGDATSVVYDLKGKKIASITGNSAQGWYDDTGECWVDTKRTKAGLVFYAGLTHSTLGGAVPAGRGKWMAWAGTSLAGTFIRRSLRRADVYGPSGVKIGRAVGRDALQAAAARLIWNAGGVPTCG